MEGLRERKKRRTRAAIVETAVALFIERGYAATTVEDVAAAAEVSPRTVFRYFTTKEDLVLAEHEAVLARWEVAVRAGPPGEPLGAALRRATMGNIAVYEERRAHFDAVEALIAAEPALARRSAAFFGHAVDRATVVLAGLLGVDPHADPRPRIVAAATHAAVQAAVARWRSEGARVPRARAVAEAFDVLERLNVVLAAPTRAAAGGGGG